jgi:hypothetical protein
MAVTALSSTGYLAYAVVRKVDAVASPVLLSSIVSASALR